MKEVSLEEYMGLRLEKRWAELRLRSSIASISTITPSLNTMCTTQKATESTYCSETPNDQSGCKKRSRSILNNQCKRRYSKCMTNTKKKTRISHKPKKNNKENSLVELTCEIRSINQKLKFLSSKVMENDFK